MAVPTVTWDENSPAGSQSIKLGDNRIREFKTQVREVINVDHDFPSSGQADDVGQHKRMTLQEQADLGTGAEGVPILGAQTVAGKAELLFTDEDDNDIQITKSGVLKPSTSTVLADWSAIMNLVYPIGSVVTLGVSTNPATLFGIGTWTAIAGKVIVGLNAGDAEFDTLNETGGAKTHSHEAGTLVLPQKAYASSEQNNIQFHIALSDNDVLLDKPQIPFDITGDTANGSSLMPYIVKYVWERVS